MHQSFRRCTRARRLHSAPVAVTRARTSSWIMPRMLYINCSKPTSRSWTLSKQEWENEMEKERKSEREEERKRRRKRGSSAKKADVTHNSRSYAYMRDADNRPLPLGKSWIGESTSRDSSSAVPAVRISERMTYNRGRLLGNLPF